MTPIRDSSQQLSALPLELQQKLLQIAIIATAMNDQERDAALSNVVTRSYFAAKIGADELVPLAELDHAVARVLQLTSGSTVGA
jgi:hypothetical protein